MNRFLIAACALLVTAAVGRAGLLPVVPIAGPMQMLPDDWYSVRPLTPGVYPGTDTRAVLTPNSDASGSYAGLKYVGAQMIAGYERWLDFETFWHSEDPDWVGVFSPSRSDWEGYVPSPRSNRFGFELTLTDPDSGQTEVARFAPFFFTGTIGREGLSVGAGSLPDGPFDDLATLTVGNHQFMIIGTVGGFFPTGGYEANQGRVHVRVLWDGPPLAPGSRPDLPAAPEPGGLTLAGLGALGLAAGCWWKQRRATGLCLFPHSAPD